MDERIEDLIPFYALGTLTKEETAQVETYLAGHPDAETELRDARYAVAAMAYDAAPATPSPRIKQVIFDRVEADDPTSSTDRAGFSLTGFIEALGFRSGWGLAMPALAAVSLVVAVVAVMRVASLNDEVERLRQAVAAVENSVEPLQTEVGPLQNDLAALRAENAALKQELIDQRELIANFATNVSLLQQADSSLQDELADQEQGLAAVTDGLAALSKDGAALVELVSGLSGQDDTLVSLQNELNQLRVENSSLQQELSSQREVMAHATSPDAQSMIILGTEKLPTAKGQLIANPTSDAGVLIVSGLPPLSQGQVYKFWLVQDGIPMAIGDINVDARGLGTLVVTSDTQIGAFEAMGVSIEPLGAEPQPANEMIMLGSFS